MGTDNNVVQWRGGFGGEGQGGVEVICNCVNYFLKSTMSYHLTPTRMATVTKTDGGEDVDKMEPFVPCWWECTML